MSNDWEDSEDSPAKQAEQIVAGLVRLAASDEACRLLGVDGTLEDEVDVTFLNDPLSWIANEVASGIRLESDESEGVPLSTLVALLRLYRVLTGSLDERELRDAVVEIMEDESEAE